MKVMRPRNCAGTHDSALRLKDRHKAQDYSLFCVCLEFCITKRIFTILKNFLKSQSLCIFTKGPWISSHFLG